MNKFKKISTIGLLSVVLGLTACGGGDDGISNDNYTMGLTLSVQPTDATQTYNETTKELVTTNDKRIVVTSTARSSTFDIGSHTWTIKLANGISLIEPIISDAVCSSATKTVMDANNKVSTSICTTDILIPGGTDPSQWTVTSVAKAYNAEDEEAPTNSISDRFTLTVE